MDTMEWLVQSKCEHHIIVYYGSGELFLHKRKAESSYAFHLHLKTEKHVKPNDIAASNACLCLKNFFLANWTIEIIFIIILKKNLINTRGNLKPEIAWNLTYLL
jgi:hypothetical protein